MCLDIKDNKWKDNFPERRKCYKVVSIYRGNICPEFKEGIFNKGINKATTNKNIRCNDTNQKYRPYFHAFLTKRAAEQWKGSEYYLIVLPIYINKKDIHCSGKQSDYVVIVTKKFEILEKDYERVLNEE